MCTELLEPICPIDLVRRNSWPTSYWVPSATCTFRPSFASTDQASAVLVLDWKPCESKSPSSCFVGSNAGLNSIMPNTPTQVGLTVLPAVSTSRYHCSIVVDAPRGTRLG